MSCSLMIQASAVLTADAERMNIRRRARSQSTKAPAPLRKRLYAWTSETKNVAPPVAKFRWSTVAAGSGLPVSVLTTSASPYEVTLVEETLAAGFAPGEFERLVGDRAYDSDPLEAVVAERGIEMIAPHRSNRKKKTQDGRKLRRYRKRWKVERLFAWLSNFRRLVCAMSYGRKTTLDLCSWAA